MNDNGLIYGLEERPPLKDTLFAALQHLLAIFVAIITPPLIVAGALGLAFQIRDDMLDVIGTKEEMGKGVGTDEDKNTFVKLYGLEKCEELVQKYTEFAIESLDAFENTELTVALAKSLTERRV